MVSESLSKLPAGAFGRCLRYLLECVFLFFLGWLSIKV